MRRNASSRMVRNVIDPMEFAEVECKVRLGAQWYELNGAFIWKRKKDMPYEGLFYVYRKEKGFFVGSWDMTILIPCTLGTEWRSNMGDRRQTVTFCYKKHSFHGVWYKSQGDIVRFKELRSRGDDYATDETCEGRKPKAGDHRLKNDQVK